MYRWAFPVFAAVLLPVSMHPQTAMAALYTPPANPRAVEDLSPGWRFIRQDVAGAETVGFDDSAWTPLDVPHTWNNLDGQDGGNNYYRGPGWYRRHYTPDPARAGHRLFLKFNGANIVTDVWVNGAYAGQHQGGFAAFVFDVTANLVAGADNVIAVKVNNASNTNIPPLSADFTFYGGIYREVSLLATEPVHITPLDYGSSGVYLKTANVSSNAADLQVTAVLSNANPATATVQVRAILTDAASNIVATLTNQLQIPPAALSNAVLQTTVANPHLWNGLFDPYVYRVFVEVSEGANLTDLVSQPLGFRYFSFDPANGFFLNGRSYPLRGVNLHQDWLNRGWAIGNAERETNFALIREIGANTIRLAHYQHHEHTYQLADQCGEILWTEAPLVNKITESTEFYENSKQQLRELIRQNCNHPSVICWGLFNEITLSSGPPVTNLVNQLAQVARAEDPTRPSTAASAAGDGDASNWYSDIVSFNKYFGWYGGTFPGFGSWADNIHASRPTRVIGVSEYGAGASLWQHSEDPVAQPTPGGAFHPEEWQNLFHESHWQQIKARPFLWATHIWNMFDFGVDSRGEGDAPGRNDKGLVSYDRQMRKDAFYWYKANWTTNPMVYITGHTFTNRRAAAITAKVYANCDSVELFLNGVSQGVATSGNCIFAWPIALNVGSNWVAAVGIKGATVATDSLAWTLRQEPYRGKPFTLPGRVQAEDYDIGPAGLAYFELDSTNSGGAFRTNQPVDIGVCSDTGGGYDVRSFLPGEWLAYTLNAASAGAYDASFRVASTNTGARLKLILNGTNLATVNLPNTGGSQSWQTVTASNLALAAGAQILRLEADTADLSLNWFEFQFRPSPGAFTVKINFQVTNSANITGYLPDVGGVFAPRNGYTYGWNYDATAQARERNSTNSADKRYDTFVHLQRGGSNIFWELAVPNGRYLARAVSGDAGYTDSYHSLTADGVSLLSAAPAADYRWIDGAAEVIVTDGRLTVAPDTNGNNSKICFLELTEPLGFYQGWRFSCFGAAANGAAAQDGADPDQDGLPNLGEYALNTSPLVSNAVPPWHAALQSNHLTLTYPRRKPPTDILYFVEGADQLSGPWTNSVTEQVLGEDGVMQTILATDSAFVTNASQRFLRLSVSRP